MLYALLCSLAWPGMLSPKLHPRRMKLSLLRSLTVVSSLISPLSLLAERVVVDTGNGVAIVEVRPAVPLSPEDQKKLIPREEQLRILQLLTDHDPRFAQFGAVFPNAYSQVTREDSSPESAGRFRIETSDWLWDGFKVTLSLGVRLNSDGSKVIDHRWVTFCVTDTSPIVKHDPSLDQMQFDPLEMDAFCQDPYAFVLKKRREIREKLEKAAAPVANEPRSP